MAYGVNAPFGLRPFQSITGATWCNKYNTYYIYASDDGATTYAANIFTNDPVVWAPTLVQAGNISVYLPAFTSATPSTYSTLPLLGSFQGCEYFDTDGVLQQKPFWPASTRVLPGSKIKAFVLDDPSTVFDIQVSTRIDLLADAYFPTPTTTVGLAGRLGRNFALDVGGGGGNLITPNPATGSTRTGISAFYLCASTAQSAIAFTQDYDKTIATLPLKAIGFTPHPSNVPKASTPFLNLLVMINNHVYGHNTAGTTLA